MQLKSRILKYRTEIIVIGMLGCALLPMHTYTRMTHLDKQELIWYKPFEKEDSVTFISTNGRTIRAYVKGELHNRPTWARISSHFNLNGPLYYSANISGSYTFPDSTFFPCTFVIEKPVSEDESESPLYLYLWFENRGFETDICTLHIAPVELDGTIILEAFFINKRNSRNTYTKNYKFSYRLVDEILWSKSLGLVYFKTADSTKYYRRDVFYNIHNH